MANRTQVRSYTQETIDDLRAERDQLCEALNAMLKLWADEWDHEGGSIVPEVVVEAREIIKEADHE